MIRFFSVLIIIAGLGWVVGSPYYVAYNMKLAADSQNSDKLASYVDFPQLQANAKQQLDSTIAAQSQGQNPMIAVLGQGLGSLLSDKIIESTITPAGLSELLRGANKVTVKTQSGDQQPTAPQSQPTPNNDVSFGYKAWDKFTIDIENQTSRLTQLILTRQGVTWKLTDVRFIKS